MCVCVFFCFFFLSRTVGEKGGGEPGSGGVCGVECKGCEVAYTTKQAPPQSEQASGRARAEAGGGRREVLPRRITASPESVVETEGSPRAPSQSEVEKGTPDPASSKERGAGRSPETPAGEGRWY